MDLNPSHNQEIALTIKSISSAFTQPIQPIHSSFLKDNGLKTTSALEKIIKDVKDLKDENISNIVQSYHDVNEIEKNASQDILFFDDNQNSIDKGIAKASSVILKKAPSVMTLQIKKLFEIIPKIDVKDKETLKALMDIKNVMQTYIENSDSKGRKGKALPVGCISSSYQRNLLQMLKDLNSCLDALNSGNASEKSIKDILELGNRKKLRFETFLPTDSTGLNAAQQKQQDDVSNLFLRLKSNLTTPEEAAKILYDPNNSQFLTAFIKQLKIQRVPLFKAFCDSFSYLPTQIEDDNTLDRVISEFTKIYCKQNGILLKTRIRSISFLLKQLFLYQKLNNKEDLKKVNKTAKKFNTWYSEMEALCPTQTKGNKFSNIIDKDTLHQYCKILKHNHLGSKNLPEPDPKKVHDLKWPLKF